MIALLQNIDNVILVLGEHLREAVGPFYCFSSLRGNVLPEVAQCGGVQDVRAHVEFFRGLLCDGERIAGHHLYLDPHLLRRRNRRLGVFPRRIEQRQHTCELPRAIPLGPRDSQGAKSAGRKVVDRFLDRDLGFAGVACQGQNDLRRPLGHFEGFSLFVLHLRLGALMNRIEWGEMQDLIAL